MNEREPVRAAIEAARHAARCWGAAGTPPLDALMAAEEAVWTTGHYPRAAAAACRAEGIADGLRAYPISAAVARACAWAARAAAQLGCNDEAARAWAAAAQAQADLARRSHTIYGAAAALRPPADRSDRRVEALVAAVLAP